MTRRLVLPAIVVLVAIVIWWFNPPANKSPNTAPVKTEPTAAPTIDEIIGEPAIARWEPIEDFDKDIALFESVFWEPDDTTSLRKWIRETPIAGRCVLEIGTGSGLVSLVCLKAGATKVVATDINPAAVRNALYNARELDLLKGFEVRRVPRRDPSAWSVIKDDEQFDLIISNPPWENATPENVSSFALYDPEFQLLTSILKGTNRRLKPHGRLLLAYGCGTAIKTIERLAPDHGLQVKRLDNRNLEDLPEVFLPGMLLELVPTHP